MAYMFSRVDVHALGDIYDFALYIPYARRTRIFMRKPCRKPEARSTRRNIRDCAIESGPLLILIIRGNPSIRIFAGVFPCRLIIRRMKMDTENTP